MTFQMSLDRIDYLILHHLQNNGRMTNADLADAVDLSPSPCLRRVKALEANGVLRRYVGIVDQPVSACRSMYSSMCR